ncbi:hypothetical protein ABFZ85_06485 [Hyphococcus formosus]|uniref:hypothetical protein n=1 Tax=Hyphococcus formosus TaxID=3143534 RepID=UPI00398A6C5E
MTDRKEKSRPSFEAFHVKDGPEDKSYFNRIGTAFPHKDGQGHTITLDAVPVDGRIVLRSPKERLEETKRGDQKRNRSERDR